MIADIKIAKVFNSKGEETVSVSVITDKRYTASVPSGTSKGKHEAAELPLDIILKNFKKIKEKLIGLDEHDYERVDEVLLDYDGTENFSKLGGNLALAISMAVAKAAASGEIWMLNPAAKYFPFPLGNVIGGGVHGGSTDIQEFLVLPPKAQTIYDAIKTNLTIRKIVETRLREKNLLMGKGLENACISRLSDIESLDLLTDIAEEYGAGVGIDMAASTMWGRGKYNYKNFRQSLTTGEQLDFVDDLIKTYDVFYIEDPFHENDFKSFSELAKKQKSRLIVGDDLYCTNYKRLENGIENKSGNGVIIKPNQVGTLSLTWKTVNLAKKAGFTCVVSHRSKDTTDNWLADLAVLFSAPIIKTGIVGKEREAKLMRLVEIWKKIKNPKMARM